MSDRLDPRARRAQELIDDPLLNEALQAIERHALRDFADSPPHDWQARERAYDLIQASKTFRDHLHQVLGTGQIEARERDRSLGDRMMSLFK